MEFDELKRQFESGRPVNATGRDSPSSAHDELVLEAARAAAGRMRLGRRRAERGARGPGWAESFAPRAWRARLLVRFSLLFVLVFGVGLAAAAYLLRGVFQRGAREQVLHDAQLIMQTALAMRSYTLDQVKPAIEGASEQGRDEGRVFRPQTVPAFATTELFAELRRSHPDYFYKEAALNPTNPRNRAVGWEQDVIRAFKNRPELKAFDGERDTPLGRSVFLARPVRLQKSCLQCHSTPARAPPEMLKVYGTANGFGWTEGDVVAAQIVSVPVSLPVRMANRALRRLLVSLALVGVVTLVAADLLLYATVKGLEKKPDPPPR